MDETTRWSEDDSGVYRELAPIAVPARLRQLATIVTLLPFRADDDFRVVELGSGDGTLGHALLLAFERGRLVALDGSDSMRAETSARLAPFGDRVTVAPFDLAQTGWRGALDGADAVVSSLVLHHLDGPAKRALYEEIGRRTSARAALVIADLVEPTAPQAAELFAATWDETARAAAESLGEPARFELFKRTHWNFYRHPDPMDKPSPLADQLTWLRAAGFALADCFWMEAGHAIYGGYKTAKQTGHVDYARARRAARAALGLGEGPS